MPVHSPFTVVWDSQQRGRSYGSWLAVDLVVAVVLQGHGDHAVGGRHAGGVARGPPRRDGGKAEDG